MKGNPVRICISICERGWEALKEASLEASQISALIEVRLDCLEHGELDRYISAIPNLANKLGVNLILTLRPADQGGYRSLDYSSRYTFWRGQQDTNVAYLMDLELDVAEAFASNRTAPGPSLDWNRVICSHHDFTCVPDDVVQIYERLASTPARILKIAVQARDVAECIPLFQLLDRARAQKREMIAIAMGIEGIATRILGPSRGAFLTYGALETKSATAPGQVTASDLKTLYRIEEINQQTLITGLLGLPVAHSISPHIHNAAFAASGVNGVYIPFEVRDLASFVRRMIHPQSREIDWNICGLSVTAPHKSAVIEYLEWIEPGAREIGAVNTIVVRENELHGYNTDAAAFLDTLTEVSGAMTADRCAIIGTGGAARAALWGLQRQGANLTVLGRNPEKARALAERFGALSATLGSVSFAGFDVVVNTTTLGTAGPSESETPATADQLRGARLVYDLVYNPTETQLLREARAAGCQTIGGLAMLVAQAVAQFKLWTGTEAPKEAMLNAASNALAAKAQLF
jgi:3-dehydroquinate dehydratase / shikimate dehydrogenase